MPAGNSRFDSTEIERMGFASNNESNFMIGFNEVKKKVMSQGSTKAKIASALDYFEDIIDVLNTSKVEVHGKSVTGGNKSESLRTVIEESKKALNEAMFKKVNADKFSKRFAHLFFKEIFAPLGEEAKKGDIADILKVISDKKSSTIDYVHSALVWSGDIDPAKSA